MRRYFAVAWFLFGFSLSGLAYAQTCNCKQELAWLKGYMAANYAGYEDKVAQNPRAYRQNWRAASARAGGIATVLPCAAVLAGYLSFFRDGHLQLAFSADVFAGHTAATTRLPDPATIQRLRTSTGIEGIYQTADSAYTMALVESPTAYRTHVGVVLESKVPGWQPGQVKLELWLTSPASYAALVYMRDKSAAVRLGKWVPGQLFGGTWHRQGTLSAAAYVPSEPLIAQSLDKQTFYFRLGSCSPSLGTAVDSLLRVHADAIALRPYFILDIRGNGGGSDYVYGPLLRYLYAGPTVKIGTDVKATRDNLSAWEPLLALEPPLPPAEQKSLTALLARMKEKPGAWVPASADDTVWFDAPTRHPSRIMVLQDRGVASSGEELLLFAAQSKKVTRLGQPSAGVLDYANMREKPLPHLPLTLLYATTRSRRLDIGKGIDETGIPPDITLPEGQDALPAARAMLR